MVRKARLSIAGLMSVVLVASLGLTALRSATEEWATVTTIMTFGVLSLGVIGAVCRDGSERAWWLGFSLFGCGYFILIFMIPFSSILYLPTFNLLKILRPTHAQGGQEAVYFFRTGESLFSLVLAVVGGFLTVFLFGGRSVPSKAVVSPVAVARAPRKWWRRSVVVAPAAVVAGTVVVLAGLRWAPWQLCTATMYATWGLLGLTAIGAVCRSGRARAAWLGAAIFGIGYMALSFGRDPDRPAWPRAGTDLLLRAFRPSWYVTETPPPSAGAAVTNAWIREVLERRVPMRYPNETPLEDVLKAIQAATRGPDGHGPAFYVDPIGLQEAEKSMQSPITIDLEGVPLRTTLYLILKQLDLTYGIQDGMVLITSEKADQDWPYSVGMDPYLSVGHCLLALLAAGLGAILAQRFCTPRDEPGAQTMSI